MQTKYDSFKESEESKDQYLIKIGQAISSKPNKGSLFKGLFNFDFLKEDGKKNKTKDDENDSYSDASENNESPSISPLQKGQVLSTSEINNKLQELNHKERLLLPKIQKILEKLAILEKSNKESKQKPSAEMETLRAELESLQTMSENIKAIRDTLESQSFAQGDPAKAHINCSSQLQKHRKTLFMHKLQLKILDLFRKVTNEKVGSLEEESENNSLQKLGCDAYLFSSVFLEYLIFFVLYAVFIVVAATLMMISQVVAFIISPFLACFGIVTWDSLKEKFANVKRHLINLLTMALEIFCLLLFLSFLLFPGALVITTQVLCIKNLQNSTTVTQSTNEGEMLILKVLMVIFFFFLSTKEVNAAIEAIGFHYKRTLADEEESSGWCILFPIRVSPQLMQILLAFWISYINIYLIYSVPDCTTLIQNFAALSIILEFDNYVMDFLRYMRFYTIYHKFIEAFIGEEGKKSDSEEQKKSKTEQLQDKIDEYEKTLQSLIQERRITKVEQDVDVTLKTAKSKLERIKTLHPIQKENKEPEESPDQQSEFRKIIAALIDNNMVKKVIRFLGKQENIKIMLTEEEFPIAKEFELNGHEKTAFNWIAFFIVSVGILICVQVCFLNVNTAKA